MRVLGKFWLIGMCLLVLVACGGDPGPTEPPAEGTPPPAPSTPASAPEMAIQEIVWAETVNPDSGEPTDIVSSFTTVSPAIIAVIEVSDVPQGTEFTATWTINDQPIEGLEMHTTTQGDLAHAWVTFSYVRDEGQLFPVGQVGVVITSSDGDVRESSAEIGFP